MGFRGRKVYGQSKMESCAFCGSIATQQNEQGVNVCRHHTKSAIEEIKCTCGSWLDQRSGKFGPYFRCVNCGNMNFQKAMEIKAITMKDVQKAAPKVEVKKVERTFGTPKPAEKAKEITITSNDVEYFD